MLAISFSLYGREPRYCIGLLKNLELVPKIYPGWQPFVWFGNDVPTEIIKQAVNLGAVANYARQLFPNGMFWRFLVHDKSEVDRYIVRDCDSRINETEARLVDEWIISGKHLHACRDHPFHQNPIMGGLWGMFRGRELIPSMRELIGSHGNVVKYGQDQDFLAAYVWPKCLGSVCQHDSFGRYGSTQDEWLAHYDGFCGEYFDEHDQPNQEHRDMRRSALLRAA